MSDYKVNRVEGPYQSNLDLNHHNNQGLYQGDKKKKPEESPVDSFESLKDIPLEQDDYSLFLEKGRAQKMLNDMEERLGRSK